jgi:multidrug efflux pump subunit AcrB
MMSNQYEEEYIDTEKGIIAWFARNSVAANLLMFIIIIGGIFGIFRVQKQVFPAFEVNIIAVQVPYLGAAPEEVEEGVILKLEEAIKDIEGIKKLTSTAREGVGSISIEVEDGYDVQNLLDEVKVQVDAIPSFPGNTEKPVVYRIKFPQDVLWVSVYGETTERELKMYAQGIRDEIVSLGGISDVSVVGSRDYEISVEISEHKLQEYDLTFSDMVTAIRQSSIDLPGGSIRSDNGDILLRANGQAYNAWDFAKIVLLSRSDGTRLLVGDIATINDGFVEERQFALFDGKPSVSLRVRAVGDQNSLQISNSVNEYLDEKRKTMPANLSIDTWGDSSFYLADRLSMMLKNMLFGALLVFIVLSLFLRVKLAFWVILGLPVCFLGTLMVMPASQIDVSINMLSLFGFILVLGIVVDDAIIMGESAYSEIDKKGHSADAVIRGVKKVAIPATFGVLTTIAAFSPMLMVSGTFGVIWKTIGIVVIMCLVFSLIESKLILPAHLVNMKLKPYDPSKANRFQKFRDFFSVGIKTFIEKKYLPFLKKAVKYRYTTLASFIGLLIITIGLFASGLVRWQFFPNIPSDFMRASVELEAGSSQEQRDQAINSMLSAMYKMDEQVVDETGTKAVKHAIAFDNGMLGGVVFVELTKGETRELTDVQIQDIWREYLPEIPGVKNFTIGSPGGPGGGNGLSFEFRSNNVSQLENISKELRSYLGGYAGITEVNDSFSGGSDEIKLELKPEAESLGLSLSQLAQQVRYGFYGAEAQRIQRDDEEIKVMVRYPKEERNSIGNLETMRIRAPNGDDIPFSEVADIELGTGYANIVRVDGNRSVSVTAKVNADVVDTRDLLIDVQSKVIPEMLQRYPEVEFRLQGNSKDETDAIWSLVQGFLFALVAIYALMAIPLKSYLQPLIIMSVIPFGMVGAIVGHLVLGQAVSVLSICGIIALAGVVVNDSLIMVDFVNRARAEGRSLIDAVLKSGSERFRAIILTSLTTFIGLMPIVFERSLQAQVVIPMAISLAFGILFATVITLLLIPALYMILDDFKQLFKRREKVDLSPQLSEKL